MKSNLGLRLGLQYLSQNQNVTDEGFTLTELIITVIIAGIVTSLNSFATRNASARPTTSTSRRKPKRKRSMDPLTFIVVVICKTLQNLIASFLILMIFAIAENRK